MAGLYTSIFGGVKGLYSSVYGGVSHASQGIYNVLFSKDGSYAPTQRMDIRLGDDSSPPFLSQTWNGIPYYVIILVVLGIVLFSRKN